MQNCSNIVATFFHPHVISTVSYKHKVGHHLYGVFVAHFTLKRLTGLFSVWVYQGSELDR